MSHPSIRSIVIALITASALAGGYVAVPAAAASDTTAPSTPTDLRVQSLSFTEVTLTWNPSTDDSGWAMYVVEISAPQAEQRFAAIEPIKTFSRLVQGQTYTATVFALDGAHNESATTTIQFTVPVDRQPPSAPQDLRATDPSSFTGEIEWDAAVDDSSDLVYLLYSGSRQIYATTGLRVRYLDVLGTFAVFPGETHTLTVRARDVGGNLSPFSNAITVTFPQQP